MVQDLACGVGVESGHVGDGFEQRSRVRSGGVPVPTRPGPSGSGTRRSTDRHTQIRELAERGVAEGEFSSEDLDGFTVRFAALADALALQRLRQAPPLSTEDAHRHLNRLIETELRQRS
ncbi:MULTISPECIES: TetR family transcriptional regulator C-terminal domain-containing protein [Streptomyces]|uniref:TetR family transcriptional regulator C-terminal domain-containing protein n=1 Tax=Streptomyces TaxID=1883 RepID=UPI002B1CD225|nr:MULTISPECIES: TetR family transcriptional regulator C-terminal domain-containing protein [Streptomyces]